MTSKCRNILLTLILAICFAVCACMFVACDEPVVPPVDDSVTYTVTVKTDATNYASGVKVQIRKGGVSFENKTTDANGKVEVKLSPDSYDVVLSDLPAGYHVAEGTSLSLSADSRDLTVTLEKNFAYTVKLVDQDGNPYYAQGVTVGVCTISETSNCLDPVELSTNGIAIIEVDAGDYHVKVYDLPANAQINVDENGYYAGENFSATKTEMTIVVTAYTITSVTDLTPMTAEEKAACAEKISSYDATAQTYVSYHMSSELAAGKIAYYSFTAKVSGIYTLYKNYSSTLLYLQNGTEFVEGVTGQGLYGDITCEANKTYYFKVINNDEEKATVEFVMTVPYSSYVNHEGKGAELELTIGKANTNAVIAFVPTEAGTYKVEVKGEALAIVEASQYQIDEIIASAPADETYTANPSTTFVMYTSDLEHSYYIAVTAKADSYPVNVNVTITKSAAIVDNKQTLQVTETLTKYPDVEGKKLNGIPMDGTAELVYNETDKYYHLGTIDGPVVVVSITEPIDADRFKAGCSLAYMELVNSRLATYKFVTRTDKGEDTIDYTIFLRGFDEYEYVMGRTGPVAQIPDEIETEVYYAKYVNKDGVYPLTEELKVFLVKFYEANSESFLWQVPEDADLEYAWLFPCYYYGKAGEDDPTPGEEDVIVATYESEDDYTLTVNADGTYTVTQESMMGSSEVESGTWIKDGENTYKFTWTAMNAVYDITLDTANGTITWVDPEMDNDEPYGVFKLVSEAEDEDVIVGEYESEDDYTLTVNADGTYTVTQESMMGSSEVESGTWIKDGENTYKFTWTAMNAVYDITLDTANGTITWVDPEMDNDEPYGVFKLVSEAEDEDVIVGEYESEDDYTLTVNADGTYTVTQESMMGSSEVESGTWIKDGENTYKFTWTAMNAVYDITLDTANGTITWVDPEMDNDEPYGVFKLVSESDDPTPDDNDVIVATYELVSFTEKDTTYNIGDTYTNGDSESKEVEKTSIILTKKADNTFTLADTLTYAYYYNGNWSTDGDTETLIVPQWEIDSTDLIINVAFDAENGTITLTHSCDEHSFTIVLQKVVENVED